LLRFMMPWMVLFLGVLIFFQVSCPAVSHGKLVPGPLLKWSENGADYAILVDKSSQKLFLYHKNDTARPVKVYRCSTGENSGPKFKKNDRKTPEGVYFFTDSYKKKDLAPIYGSKAFPIDYPNPLDKKKGKGGYGIWFHGTNKLLEPRDTNGCIVLENGSIDDLASYIRLHETPAIISSRIEMVPRERQEQEAEELEKIIEKWRSAWEKKDLEGYMALYSRNFSARGMDWGRWEAYKRRLGKKYGRIRVAVRDLQLFKINDSLLARFHQTYRADAFESRGEKTLYLVRNSNQYKIIGEVFEQDSKARKFFRKKRDPLLPEIKQFVDAWLTAWEKKDVAAYEGAYDPMFLSNGMDMKAWMMHKAKLNRKYGRLKIMISRLKILQRSDVSARVRFKQDYRADAYHDFGVKDLHLVRRGKQWKIKKETWRPMATKRNQ